jgi:hypothetical protein
MDEAKRWLELAMLAPLRNPRTSPGGCRDGIDAFAAVIIALVNEGSSELFEECVSETCLCARGGTCTLTTRLTLAA